MHLRLPDRRLVLATLILSVPPFARAGSMSLAWNAASGEGVEGYRVYYGQGSRSYTGSKDAGSGTSETVTGLADCTNWYVAVKAYDVNGLESQGYSNEISGWPRPVVSKVNPLHAEEGRRLTLTLTGSNFAPGATVAFSDAGLVVNAVTVVSCTQITVDATLRAPVSTERTSVTVTNPDSVYGTGPGTFRIDPKAPPTVSYTTPADGDTGVGASVRPTVRFSEAMKASTVTKDTVLLLDASGKVVPQTSVSPTLNGSGKTATIRPAAPLAVGKRYRVKVIGGTSGVLDLVNLPLGSTYVHGTGFLISADITAASISEVHSTSVGKTTADVVWSTDEPTDSQVLYRKAGDEHYLETRTDIRLVTEHQHRITGLFPATAYEFFVRSADQSGNASISSPDVPIATLESPYAYVKLEAEGGEVPLPLQIVTGETASGDGWIELPSEACGTGEACFFTAGYAWTAPYDGSWRVWVRVLGGDLSEAAWSETVDGVSDQALTGANPDGWRWVRSRVYTLGAGEHRLELSAHAAGARADQIVITDDPEFVPETEGGDDGGLEEDEEWLDPLPDEEASPVSAHGSGTGGQGRMPSTPVRRPWPAGSAPRAGSLNENGQPMP